MKFSNFNILFFIIVLSISIVCCSESNNKTPFISVVEIPSSKFSETPNLAVSDSAINLIWTESKGDSMGLYHWQLGIHNKPTLIGEGTDWFVNWADFPSIASDNQGNMIVNWLQKSDDGTYDYDVHFSRYTKQTGKWSPSLILHKDKVAAEHGFVSFTSYDSNNFYASWLDGRYTKTRNPLKQGSNLPMTIRGGFIDKKNSTIREFEIDNKVCDCCQTSSAMVADGILTAYRDRTDEEIRDITIQKIKQDTIVQVFNSNDKWKINGCPVNGPALDAKDNIAAMVWYTAHPEPSVWMVVSEDNGNTYSEKTKIDSGNPMGRVDVGIEGTKAYFTWLEMKDDQAVISLRAFDIKSHVLLPSKEITTTSSARQSGFPVFKVKNNIGYLVHTKVLSSEESSIQLNKIDLTRIQ